mgnify:CR=1 FL=1
MFIFCIFSSTFKKSADPEKLKIIKEEIETVLEQAQQLIDRKTTIKLIDDPAGDMRLGAWRNYLNAAYQNPDPEIYTDPNEVSKYKLVHQSAVLIKKWIDGGEEIPPKEAHKVSRALDTARREKNKIKATIDFAEALQTIQPER